MCEFHGSNCNGLGDIWWTDKCIYFSSIDSSKSQAYLALTEQEQSEPVDKEQSRITRPRRHALKHRCS